MTFLPLQHTGEKNIKILGELYIVKETFSCFFLVREIHGK